jgi:predicted TIM-barrel enzyme
MAAVEQQTLLMGARMGDESHLCFMGVAFKYQPHESNPGRAAANAHALGLIPTTSGPATGQCADLAKLKQIRKALPAGAPLALASGITPSNVHDYRGIVTHALVATGINKADGSELIDEALLLALVERSR